MKVLLIGPYARQKKVGQKVKVKREDFYPSAALLHLAAILRVNKYKPIIIDLNNTVVHEQGERHLDYCEKIIIDSLNEHKPDLVCINCLFSGYFPDVMKFARIIKSHSPNLKIAIGGIHPTTFPKEILTNCNDIDYVAIGEGEKSIVALADSIKAKNENLLSSIKSFSYKDKDGVVRVNREQNYVEDLNSLPMPAWDLIDLNHYKMNLDDYYNPQKLPIKHKVGIFSSRACPLSCNFCDMFLVMGKKHRKRSAKTIVDEIEFLNKNHGVNYFSFMDDNLTLNRTHIIEVCDEILKRKLKILFDCPNGVWINSIREEIVAKMVEAGLACVSLAIEHGDDYIRNKVIKKLLDREKIFEVNALFKKYKVMRIGWYIMGFPEDTNETLQHSLDMMHELKTDKTTTSVVAPYPGTALFKQVVRDNLFIKKRMLNELWKTPMENNQDEFIIKPYNMSVDELYEWRRKFDKLLVKYWKTNPTPPVMEKYYKDKSNLVSARSIW